MLGTMKRISVNLEQEDRNDILFPVLSPKSKLESEMFQTLCSVETFTE